MKKGKTREIVREVKNGKQCSCCGKVRNSKYFYYKTKSFIYKNDGLFTICKDCIGELYDRIFIATNSEEKTMYRLCRKLDIPYRRVLFDMAKNEAGKIKKDVYRTYFQKLNSLGGVNNYGDDFDDSDDLDANEVQKMDRDFNDIEELENDLISGFELSVEMVRFWGTGLSTEDYKFLQDEFDDWQNRYEIDSKSLELLVKNMCFTSLTIKHKRAKGDSVDKELKTLQDLMASCNLKPSQESALNSAEQATFGTLIKKWENEQPIPEPDPEWKDVNNIAKYIRIWFTGHLSRMMGVEAGISDEYLKEIESYTVMGDENG